MSVTYTDGTPVQEGDHIRYHQAPGGLLSPPRRFRNGERTLWTEGVAVMPEDDGSIFGNAMVLRAEDGRHYHLLGHVIERIAAPR